MNFICLLVVIFLTGFGKLRGYDYKIRVNTKALREGTNENAFQ